MVKIPNLDDLKKMSSGLIDTAKSVKFGEVVDKLKSGMESVSIKKSPVSANVSDEAVQALFTSIYTNLNDLMAAQAAEVEVVKKIQLQLAELAKVLERYQQSTETKQDEDKKV